MERWWVNGQPGRVIDVTDRGLIYGDGLFETIAVRDGAPRFLALHLDRLLDGCRRLGFAAPDRAGLQASLAAATGRLSHAVLKVIITRGGGPRGYAPPDPPATTAIWGTSETRPLPSLPIDIRWCETMVSLNPATAGLKSLGRLEQVLARAEWTRADIAEGLMKSTAGLVVGGTSSNVFVVDGERLLTPSLCGAGIAGVMRRVVLETARRAGIEALEADLVPAAIHGATELFVTNALTGIRPVRRLESRTLEVGPLTQRLRALLAAAGVGECAGGS